MEAEGLWTQQLGWGDSAWSPHPAHLLPIPELSVPPEKNPCILCHQLCPLSSVYWGEGFSQNPWAY